MSYDAQTWKYQAEALLEQLEQAHNALEYDDVDERERVWESIAGDLDGSLMTQTRNMLRLDTP